MQSFMIIIISTANRVASVVSWVMTVGLVRGTGVHPGYGERPESGHQQRYNPD